MDENEIEARMEKGWCISKGSLANKFSKEHSYLYWRTCMIWNTKNAQTIRMQRVEFMLVESARVSRKLQKVLLEVRILFNSIHKNWIQLPH